MSGINACFKRSFDLLAATCGLVVVSPVLLIAAIVIYFDSPGGILFRQQRIGRGFRPFQLLKLRTMTADPDSTGPQITSATDPRITRSGKCLRKWKIDELPQLLNVIKGEMSLVGPRPEVLKYVERFHDDYVEVLKVRPGITDVASVRYFDEAVLLASSKDPERDYVHHILPDKLQLQKEYVRSHSLFGDLVILGQTLLHLKGILRKPLGECYSQLCKFDSRKPSSTP